MVDLPLQSLKKMETYDENQTSAFFKGIGMNDRHGG